MPEIWNDSTHIIARRPLLKREISRTLKAISSLAQGFELKLQGFVTEVQDAIDYSKEEKTEVTAAVLKELREIAGRLQGRADDLEEMFQKGGGR